MMQRRESETAQALLAKRLEGTLTPADVAELRRALSSLVFALTV